MGVKKRARRGSRGARTLRPLLGRGAGIASTRFVIGCTRNLAKTEDTFHNKRNSNGVRIYYEQGRARGAGDARVLTKICMVIECVRCQV